MPAKRLGANGRASVLAQVQAGVPIKTVASNHGVTRSAIYRALERMGYRPMRSLVSGFVSTVKEKGGESEYSPANDAPSEKESNDATALTLPELSDSNGEGRADEPAKSA